MYKFATSSIATAALIACLTASSGSALAQDDTAHPHDHAAMMAAQGQGQAHVHDHSAMLGMELKQSMMEVDVPAVKLVSQNGVSTLARKELLSGKPTVLAFIYTSCTTICPMTSQIMERVQTQLGSKLPGTRLVSVSIDPEYDTPARLLAYSQRYNAAPQWQHYTGTLANSVAIQKAFKAFLGDKMNHMPLIFVNGGNSKSWVRFDGFPSSDQVVKALEQQSGS